MATDNPMREIFDDYPEVISQQVLWGDMDAFEHVNNTIYFRYFEDVRIAYFGKTSVLEHMEKTGIGPILASTQCNFKLPLKYPDNIYIGARSTILSPKKVQMDYRVYSEDQKGIAAEGQGLLVFYNYHLAQSCEVPEPVVTAIHAFEGLT